MEYKEALELTGNPELAIKLLEADAKQTQAKAFAMIGIVWIVLLIGVFIYIS